MTAGNEMSDPQPFIVRGNIGWGNPERPVNGTQFEAYGPAGRHAPRATGDSLIDALVAAGGNEGDRLIVVAVPRYLDDEEVERKIRAVLDLPQEAVNTSGK
jgi:hypothetical protein